MFTAPALPRSWCPFLGLSVFLLNHQHSARRTSSLLPDLPVVFLLLGLSAQPGPQSQHVSSQSLPTVVLITHLFQVHPNTAFLSCSERPLQPYGSSERDASVLLPTVHL